MARTLDGYAWGPRGAVPRAARLSARRHRRGWYVNRWMRDRQPTHAGHMAIASLVMGALAVLVGVILAVSTVVSGVAEGYSQITRDLPSITQLATREMFQTTRI